MKKIPLLDLQAQYSMIRWEVRSALDRVCDSQHFILGPEVNGLELEIASFCRAKFAVGVSSGTDALLAALMAVGIGPGDEVITTSFSFFATAGVIARLQARSACGDLSWVGSLPAGGGKSECAVFPGTALRHRRRLPAIHRSDAGRESRCSNSVCVPAAIT